MIEKLTEWLDGRAERAARLAAQRVGRRSVLTSLGAALVGGALLPMLPFDKSGWRAFAAEGAGDEDETACDYWRYCALDGDLCNKCGGTVSSCPPGSQVSTVSWVGTCRNPADDTNYLVSYNDCCGKSTCAGDAFCFRSEGERPGYRMGLYNDINWCMANTSKGYHCTVAAVVGLA